MISPLVTILAFAGMGGWEVFLIITVVILLFGAKKIPELAKGLGNGIREFKDATSGARNEVERLVNQPPTTAATPEKPKETPLSNL